MTYAPDGTCFEWHGNEGPVVVLVHGLGLNKAMWQWQIPVLSETYRVLTYDLLGHGHSPAPGDVPDLTSLSEQLYSLLDAEGVEKCAVLGFSLGGMIARRFAMDHPDRLSGIGILFSPYKRSDEARAKVASRVEQARIDGPAATVEAALVRWFTDDYRAGNPLVMDQIREWVTANDKSVYPLIYKILVDGVDELAAPDPAISCPALVMTGEDDSGNPPAMSRAIAAEIPDAVIVILTGLRHMAMVEAPDSVNQELLAFLAEL